MRQARTSSLLEQPERPGNDKNKEEKRQAIRGPICELTTLLMRLSEAGKR